MSVSKRKKVLLVDDDMRIHNLLQKFSNLHNITLISINDGKSGLEFILKNNYDVILLDYMMPGYSGIDLLYDLAKKTDVSKLNIFMFTAINMNPYAIDSLKKLGVKQVIKKPIKLQLLLELIDVEDSNLIEWFKEIDVNLFFGE